MSSNQNPMEDSNDVADYAHTASAIARAQALGIDISLLMESLRWSPTERIMNHHRSLQLAEALQQAGRQKHHERLSSSPSSSP